MALASIPLHDAPQVRAYAVERHIGCAAVLAVHIHRATLGNIAPGIFDRGAVVKSRHLAGSQVFHRADLDPLGAGRLERIADQEPQGRQADVQRAEGCQHAEGTLQEFAPGVGDLIPFPFFRRKFRQAVVDGFRFVHQARSLS